MVENVHHHVSVIQQDPPGTIAAFPAGFAGGHAAQLVFHVLGDGLNLPGGFAATDDEEVCQRVQPP